MPTSGVASFEGIGTIFTANSVTGSHDAGIYIGDIPDANAVVTTTAPGAMRWAFGPPSQNVSCPTKPPGATVSECSCSRDGQAGGSGQSAVLNNEVTANNEVCQQFANAGFLPVLGAAGSFWRGRSTTPCFTTS